MTRSTRKALPVDALFFKLNVCIRAKLATGVNRLMKVKTVELELVTAHRMRME